ncbi:MAG: type II toxin-antitoxin system RelE/ParE family toxin [Saprospiraceae bacterium]|nr:type II toxin-antitoxin system RelE/ParE family toxin [Saprospiraceae bacterium]
MAYNVVLLQTARQGLWEAIDWYNEQSVGLGNELMAEFFEHLKKLPENPHRFKYILKPFRRLRLKRFPYLIIFRIDEARQRVVVAVFWHEKRDPERLERVLR